MSALYSSEAGDMLDAIAHKTYGDAAMVAFILQANPGLVDKPLLLPYGVQILLPDAPVKPVKNALQDVWG